MAHPDLLKLTHFGKRRLFIDCTYAMTPIGFYQTMIIMVYDPSTQIYVPIWYILMTSKSSVAYWHAFNLCITYSNWKLEASAVSCDFEEALIKNVEIAFNFTNDYIVGCKFHHVKLLKEYLKKEGFPK